MRTSSTPIRVALVVLLGATFPIACLAPSSSGDRTDLPSLNGPDTGATTGGTTTGGSGSGTGSSGASTGGSTGGDDPTTCVYEGAPLFDPADLPACASCGGAHCVPNGLVPADQAGSLAACDGESLCVPDEFIVTGGDFLLQTCESVNGAEGRCASKCLPAIAEQAANLPQGTCPDTHLCGPCFSPLDGSDTGLCRLACDTGPAEPPVTLPACCGGIGQCVPSNLVPAGQADKFGEDECPQDGGALICVPDVFLGGTYTPIPCETGFVAVLFGDEYKPGACLPECMPDVDSAPFLGQGECPEANKCVPCLDPQTGESSGACDPQ